MLRPVGKLQDHVYRRRDNKHDVIVVPQVFKVRSSHQVHLHALMTDRVQHSNKQDHEHERFVFLAYIFDVGLGHIVVESDHVDNMHEQGKEVETASVVVPLVLHNLLDYARVEDVELLCFTEEVGEQVAFVVPRLFQLFGL